MTTLDYIIYIFLFLLVVAFALIIHHELKIKRLLGGSNAKSIEDLLKQNKKELDELRTFKSESTEYFKNIEARLCRSIQSVETVRFNPFKGTGVGGNQSFSTAFLNEGGDGLILSTLHTRDQVKVFAKPLAQYQSQFELSDEESQVTKKAKDLLQGKNK